MFTISRSSPKRVDMGDVKIALTYSNPSTIMRNKNN